MRLKFDEIKACDRLLIFLCFFISVASASAIDDTTMENVSMANEEINLEVSNGIETIDDLNSAIQNAAPNSTIKLENDIIVTEDTKCQGIEVSEKITIDGQRHKIDGNSSGAPFFLRIHGDNVVLKNMVFVNWQMDHSYNLIEWIGPNGEMRNCTFTNNIASNGGAIYNTGSAKVIMSIFSDNTGYSSVAKLGTKIDIYNNDGSLEDVVIF